MARWHDRRRVGRLVEGTETVCNTVCAVGIFVNAAKTKLQVPGIGILAALLTRGTGREVSHVVVDLDAAESIVGHARAARFAHVAGASRY